MYYLDAKNNDCLISGLEGNRRMRPAVLQPGLHDAAGEAGGPVQVQVPLVLLRRVPGVCAGRTNIHLQLRRCAAC